MRFAGICKAPSRLLSIIGMLLVAITISRNSFGRGVPHGTADLKSTDSHVGKKTWLGANAVLYTHFKCLVGPLDDAK